MLNGRVLIHLFLFVSVMQGSLLNSQQQQQRIRKKKDKERGEREREKNKYKDISI